MTFIYYMIIGVGIFAIKFGLQPKWRKYLSNLGNHGDEIIVYIIYVLGYMLAWPFIALALYFWKDKDETREAGEDSE